MPCWEWRRRRSSQLHELPRLLLLPRLQQRWQQLLSLSPLTYVCKDLLDCVTLQACQLEPFAAQVLLQMLTRTYRCDLCATPDTLLQWAVLPPEERSRRATLSKRRDALATRQTELAAQQASSRRLACTA